MKQSRTAMWFKKTGFLLFSSVVVFSSVSIAALGADEATDDYQDIETVEVVGPAITSSNLSSGTKVIFDTPKSDLSPPAVLYDVLALAPSANVRINSRGEALVSFRGAGERQFAAFFDGVPLNVPWDNRLDLRLIPLIGVGTTSISTGPTAARFGAGTAGGVVELQPEARAGVRGLAEIASGDAQRIEGSYRGSFGVSDFLLAVGHADRDGLRAEKNSRSVFAGPDGNLMTNTDRQQSNVLVHFKTQLSSSDTLSATLLYNDAIYGVATEQGKGFPPDDARYWRYPESEYLFASLKAQIDLGDKTTSEFVVWRQSFNQEIQSFSDDTYGVLQDTQQDRNDAFGVRASVSKETQQGALTFSGSVLSAEHREVARSLLVDDHSDDLFSNSQYGLALDYEHRVSDELTLNLGAGYDVLDPTKTAGRGNAGRFSGVNSVAEIKWMPAGEWQFRASAGRRVRLPTMRELFGDAIGRFVLNPDLTAEQIWQFDLAALWQSEKTSFQIVPFASLTNDTLDQRRIDVGGQLLRQRFNLRGSRTFGIEAQGATHIGENLEMNGHLTWNTHHVLRETVDNSTRRLYLSDRPNWLARANAAYQLGTNTTFGLSVVYRGEARSQDSSGDFRKVSASTQLNLALSHQLAKPEAGLSIALYVRADNLTDVFVEPQLGLPERGRTFLFGLTADL